MDRRRAARCRPARTALYADFVPAGGEGLTLAADLGVAGDYAPQPVPAPLGRSSVDGYDVSFDGELVAGEVAELAVTVTRDGDPVTDLAARTSARSATSSPSATATWRTSTCTRSATTDGPGGPTVRFARRRPDGRHVRLVLRLLPRRRGAHRGVPCTTAAAASDESRTRPTRWHDD